MNSDVPGGAYGRRKLLALHYEDTISAEQFAEAQADLTRQIDAARDSDNRRDAEQADTEQLGSDFERVSGLLAVMDVRALWHHAQDAERKQLLDELLDYVTVQPDHIEVEIHGAPRLNVALYEVGLRAPGENTGVGGGT